VGVLDMPGEATASDRLKDVPRGGLDMEGDGRSCHRGAACRRQRALTIDKQNRTHRRGGLPRAAEPYRWRAMGQQRSMLAMISTRAYPEWTRKSDISEPSMCGSFF